MKAKLSILALGAMALVSSCSNDQTVDINDGNAIKFGVTAGKSSRATENGMTQLEGGFQVWANDGTSETNYINGAIVKKEGSSWTMNVKKFWPYNSLSFFALYPANLDNVTINKTEKAFSYTVANGQTDVLYASNLNFARPTSISASTVGLNFYHALSQIMFKVQNSKPGDIIVEVKGISIKNVKSEGKFAWNTANSTESSKNNDYAGSWTNHATLKTYAAWTGTTTLDNSHKEDDFGASPANLFLMPQTMTPWYDAATKNWNFDGARVLVDCVIKDKDTGIQLWPKAGVDAKKEVAISLPGTWLPGRKYTYTIVFGDGAGYDESVTTPEDPTPNPVLVPISFEVSVSGFENGNGDNGEELSGKTN